jgi:hypothetical protein
MSRWHIRDLVGYEAQSFMRCAPLHNAISFTPTDRPQPVIVSSGCRVAVWNLARFDVAECLTCGATWTKDADAKEGTSCPYCKGDGVGCPSPSCRLSHFDGI